MDPENRIVTEENGPGEDVGTGPAPEENTAAQISSNAEDLKADTAAPVSEPEAAAPAGPSGAKETEALSGADQSKSKKKVIFFLIPLILLLIAGVLWYALLGPGATRYTVSFDTVGGTPVADVQVVKGRSLKLPVTEKEGYMFLGWELDGTGIPTPFKPEGDVTLKAVWEGNVHKVTFDPVSGEMADFGTEPFELPYATGDPIRDPGTPKKVGFSFVGWQDENGNFLIDGDEMPDRDLSFTAVYEENTYRITFDTDGGSELPVLVLHEGDSFVPGSTIKKYYKFDHWETADGKTVKPGDVLPCEDVTLYAKWKHETFKVSFDSKGGSSVSPITVNAGDKLKLPAPPTRPNYTFVTWEDKWGKSILDGALLEPEDVTLYAVWERITFKVTFVSNGGSAVPSITVNAGDTLKLPANPTRAGYTFRCWEDEWGQAILDGALLAPEDITLYAVWDEADITDISISSNITYLTPISADVVVNASVTTDNPDKKTVSWVVEGDVDYGGSGLAMKIAEGNKITFKIGTRGLSNGGTFTVYATGAGGKVVSNKITVTVEPRLKVTSSGSAIISHGDESAGVTTISYQIKSDFGRTWFATNQDVTFDYSTSNGVLTNVSVGSNSISAVIMNVGSGGSYTGAQIKATTKGGQTVTIVINPVA